MHRVAGSLLLGLGTAGLLAVASCGGPQEGCAAEQWAGTCTLRSVNTIRQMEQGAVAVNTLEAIWSPQANAAYPNFTPPELRQEYRVAADMEPALRAHLQGSVPVQCQLVAPPAGVCEPAKLIVSVPPFTPPATAPRPAEDTAEGCVQLEDPNVAQQVAHPIKPSSLGAASFQETYAFDQDSSTPSPEVAAQIKAAAQIIATHPELVCISVTGHITRGESLQVADQRARAVRDILVAGGVPASRLVAFGAGIPVYGDNQAPPPADPTERNVGLSVLRLKK